MASDYIVITVLVKKIKLELCNKEGGKILVNCREKGKTLPGNKKKEKSN